MVCQDLFREIDQMEEEFLQMWENVCNIESPTSSKQGVDAVSSYFIRMAQEQGWQVEVAPFAVSGDAVCITMNAQADLPPISLSGHLDTVHPVGLFGTPAVHTDEEKIYGPGVADCKGGVVAGLLAMHALENCGYKKRPVQMLLQTDEEVGSKLSQKATINWICEQAKNAVAFMNLETAVAGKACLQRKGIITYRLTITGKAAHASRCATEGASAIADAAHKIIELEKLKDAGGLTCSVGTIEGGSAANTVPEQCVLLANIRFATLAQLEWVKDYVKSIAETVHVPGCTCELKQESFRIAMEYHERNVELLGKLNKIFVDCGMQELTVYKGTGGSDAADVTAYGIPCVENFGVIGTGVHSIHEKAEIPSLVQSAKMIAAAALGL